MQKCGQSRLLLIANFKQSNRKFVLIGKKPFLASNKPKAGGIKARFLIPFPFTLKVKKAALFLFSFFFFLSLVECKVKKKIYLIL